MKIRLSGFLLVSILLLNTLFSYASGKKGGEQNFFVGTYTDGDSEGIYRYSLNPTTGKLTERGLAAKSNNPSFLALTTNGKFLLAVHEILDNEHGAKGYIESFAVDKKKLNLRAIGKVSSGGAHPCYVSVNNDGYALSANYTGGSVALFHLNSNGSLSEPLDLQQHQGHGLNLERQADPHVHSAFFEPGSDRVFVPDLGIDQVLVYQLDKKNNVLKPSITPFIQMDPGSGPRHLTFHPNKRIVYIINELTCKVSVVSCNSDGSFTILQSVSSLPIGYDQPNTSADIHISGDGRFLYVSNRGVNAIAIFSVDSLNGKIEQIGQESTLGEMPRNFTLSPDDKYLLVANQKSENIVAFRRDAKTGKLQYTDQIKSFKPVCLLFMKP